MIGSLLGNGESILLEKLSYRWGLNELLELRSNGLVLGRPHDDASLLDRRIVLGRNFSVASLVFHVRGQREREARMATSADPEATKDAVWEMFSPSTNLSFTWS